MERMFFFVFGGFPIHSQAIKDLCVVDACTNLTGPEAQTKAASGW